MTPKEPVSVHGNEPAPRTGSFTVRGTRNGSLVWVTWDDGQLTGDYSTIDLVELQADLVSTSTEDDYLRHRFVRPNMPSHGGLADPVVAYALILETIDTERETTGSLAAVVTSAVGRGTDESDE